MSATQTLFAQLVQDFFLRRLIAQRGASARTVESYRDTFSLLFAFIEQHTGTTASALELADIDAPLVLDFLDYLETGRGNSTRTRNARLAAIHSFMRYAQIRDPASLPVAQQVLAIPAKRFDQPVLGYLTREQITAVLAAPDRSTWSGHRDGVMLATAYNTGARASEITALHVGDVLLDPQAAVHLHGKGRKQRVLPLWKTTAAQLRTWLPKTGSEPGAPLFPNRAAHPDPLRPARPARPGRRHRHTKLPVPARPARHPAHDPSLNGNAPASIRHRPSGHRPLDGPLQPIRDSPLP